MRRRVRTVTKMQWSFARAFRYAAAGVIHTIRVERNMRIHWVSMMLALIVELVIRPSMVLSLLVFTVGIIVIALELVNTAVESAVDLTVRQQQHELARIAKDVAAGAVLVAALGAFIVGVGMLLATYPWHWYLWSYVHAKAAWLNLIVLVGCAVVFVCAVWQCQGSKLED